MSAYTCARTEITNTSNRVLPRVSIFGGRRMAKGEVLVIKGDVWAWLAGKFPGIKGRRMIEKLHDLVNAGELGITAIPSTCGDAYDSSSSTFLPA